MGVLLKNAERDQDFEHQQFDIRVTDVRKIET